MRHSSASRARALQQELQDVEAISRHALAHASVIEFFFRRAPVIPLKLFTLFSSDEKTRRACAQPAGGVETDVCGAARSRGVGRAHRGGRSGSRIGAHARQRPRLSEGEEAAARTNGRAIARHACAPRMARSRPLAASRRKPGKRHSHRRGAGARTSSAHRFSSRPGGVRPGKRTPRSSEQPLPRRDIGSELNGPWPPYHFVSK